MPPLPSVEIPVIVRSDFKGKTPVRAPKPRMYNDEPLPVVPSNYAPKNAKIVGREIKISGVSYHLKIGEVEINDVSVLEILEYVSALDLEQYEHEQFEEERMALEAAEAAEQERKREKLERMKHRAKTKGVVFYTSDTGSNDETEGGEEVVGRHGRARPTYTHLFMKINARKGEAVEPSSDMMLTATDEDEDEEESEDEPVARAPVVRGPVSFTELPKRRRRKRDKVTGELLPLSPKVQKAESALSEKKRQRRRRHPLTGELMPVGWRYDPNDQSDRYENRRTGPSMSARKLSSSQEHEAKRPRLDTASEMSRSSSPLPAKENLAKKASPTTPRSTIGQHRPQSKLAAVVDLVSSEDEREVRSPTKAAMPLKSPPKPMQSRPTISAMMRSAALSSAAETSPEPVLRPFLLPPSKTKITSPKAAKKTASPKRSKTPKTSILNASAGRASSTEPPVQLSNEDEDEDEESDDEYFIENVLAHSWSDPRTHPSSLGDKPVMLYQVKWEGYTEPSWEPAESFTDKSVLDEYRRRVGLPLQSSDEEKEDDDEEQEQTVVAPQGSTPEPTGIESADDGAVLDEDEYEVEGIVGHHLSDPRTHPPELGPKPVMLYYVKWKGYDELTWEPVTSFENMSMVQTYNEEFGLKDTTMESDDDKEMDEVA